MSLWLSPEPARFINVGFQHFPPRKLCSKIRALFPNGQSPNLLPLKTGQDIPTVDFFIGGTSAKHLHHSKSSPTWDPCPYSIHSAKGVLNKNGSDDHVFHSIMFHQLDAHPPFWRNSPHHLELYHVIHITSYSGWWFGTFFIFPYIGNNHPN